MRSVRRIVYFVVILMAICFAVLNRDPVTVDLFVYTVEIRLFYPVLGAAALGWLCGLLVEGVVAGRWRWRARSGERRAATLESQVSSLREEVGAARKDAAPAPPRQRLAARSRALLKDS